MATITISEEDLQQVTLAVGSILTNNNDGKPLLYTDLEIKTVAIQPALEYYFTKFPIKISYEQEIISDTSVDIPYPDQTTYGVTDISIVNRANGATNSGFNFWNVYNFQNLGYGSTGNGLAGGYGSGYNLNGSKHLRHLLRSEMDTLANEGTYRYNINHSERKVTVYSSFLGNIYLKWAKFSYDFNQVNFARKKDVIKLAKGFLMKETGIMLSIIPETGATIDIDAGVLKETGQEYIDEITEKWASVPSFNILRS